MTAKILACIGGSTAIALIAATVQLVIEQCQTADNPSDIYVGILVVLGLICAAIALIWLSIKVDKLTDKSEATP